MVGNIKLSNKLLLAEFLKTVPDDKFYMKSYFNFKKGSGKSFNKFESYERLTSDPRHFINLCDTTACVAGHACVIWPECMDENDPNTVLLRLKLGIDYFQSQELFFNYDATRQDQIDLLEKWAVDDRIS